MWFIIAGFISWPWDNYVVERFHVRSLITFISFFFFFSWQSRNIISDLLCLDISGCCFGTVWSDVILRDQSRFVEVGDALFSSFLGIVRAKFPSVSPVWKIFLCWSSIILFFPQWNVLTSPQTINHTISQATCLNLANWKHVKTKSAVHASVTTN